MLASISPVSITIDEVALLAVLLGSVHAFAWLSVVPPFSASYVPKSVRVAISLCLGLVAQHSLGLTAVPSLPVLLGDVVAEALTGFLFGMLVAILLSVIPAAGDTLDLFGGLVLPPSLESMGFQAATSLGTFYGLIELALLFVSGGELLLIRGFLTSFVVVGPTLGSLLPLAHVASREVGTFFTATFEVAGPIIAVEFVTELALGLLSKAAPQVNIFLFAFSVQTVVLILALLLGVALLPSAVERLVHLALHYEGALL
jgi:flagellar biosynthetic protein FliR